MRERGAVDVGPVEAAEAPEAVKTDREAAAHRGRDDDDDHYRQITRSLTDEVSFVTGWLFVRQRLRFQQSLASGCGSVGRAVTSEIRDPRLWIRSLANFIFYHGLKFQQSYVRTRLIIRSIAVSTICEFLADVFYLVNTRHKRVKWKNCTKRTSKDDEKGKDKQFCNYLNACLDFVFIFFFCFRFNRILFNFSDAFVATNSSVFTFRLRFCWNYLSFCFCRFCCHRCFAYTRLKHAFYSLHYLYGPLPISTIGREWVWESKRRTTTEGGEKQTRKDLRKIERNIVWKMEIDG